MIKIIIYLSIIIILYFCLLDNSENFQADIYTSKNCCVIRKKRLDNKFIYTYKRSQYCDNYHDNFLRVIKEGELVNDNPFNMKNCKLPKNNKSTLFGSCRKLGGFECVDFVTNKDCNKYPNLNWYPISCNNQIPIPKNYYNQTDRQLIDIII